MHFKSIKRPTIYAIIISLMLICGSPVYAQSNSSLHDEVVLQLRWEHQFQFAGYYAALWQGYYKEAGLEVDIRSGFDENGNVILAPDAVANGDADFGIGGVDLLIAVDSGKPIQIVSTIFQRSPVAYYMLPNTHFQSIYDFTNLNVARRSSDLLDIELQALLVDEGIDPTNHDFIKKDVVLSFDDLKTGRYDVIPGYLDTIEYQAHLQGLTLKKVNPVDFGVDFYGDSLFTSTELANQRPKMVERFRKATLQGWAYALEHPDEISERIVDTYYSDATDREALIQFNKFQAKNVSELTLYPVVDIGNTNPYRWKNMLTYLKALNLIHTNVTTDDILFDYRSIRESRSAFYIRVYQSVLSFLAIAALFGYITHMNRKNIKLKGELEFRKETEKRISLNHERYQRMFNSSFLGITVTDRHGKILRANDKWSEMTGYSHEELLEMRIFDILSPESRVAGKNSFKKLRDGSLHEIDLKRMYYKKDGSQFWGQLYMTSIRDPETYEENYLGMVLDITKEKLQREAAERAEATILYQSRQAAMGEMIGNIAHQWRQPLNNLGLILTNIEDGYRFDDLSEQEVYESCSRAQKLIGQMSETIDDFQNFLNPGSTAETFELMSIVDTVEELLKDSLKINRIQIVRIRAEKALASGVKNQLAQAIFNIVNNAIDAIRESNPSERRIEISVYSSQGFSCLDIQDYAGGMPKDVAEQAFEPYFTTKSREIGTGLGLHITRTIVENSFNGTIQLATSPTGTTFRITLPSISLEGDQS